VLVIYGRINCPLHIELLMFQPVDGGQTVFAHVTRKAGAEVARLGRVVFLHLAVHDVDFPVGLLIFAAVRQGIRITTDVA